MFLNKIIKFAQDVEKQKNNIAASITAFFYNNSQTIQYIIWAILIIILVVFAIKFLPLVALI